MRFQRNMYGWRPQDAKLRTDRPTPGDLLVHEHAVYRVVEVRDVQSCDWTDEEHRRAEQAQRIRNHQFDSPRLDVPIHITVRPVEIVSDDPRARDHDLHMRHSGYGGSWWSFTSEHYPVCATCREPRPCREQHGISVAEHQMQRMSRFETPGVCPACQETVTHRQRSIRFTENLELPGGPAVVFHLRKQCFDAARNYEERWVSADPEQRRGQLSCPGVKQVHHDGTWDCSEQVECRGDQTAHGGMDVCRCAECRERGHKMFNPARVGGARHAWKYSNPPADSEEGQDRNA